MRYYVKDNKNGWLDEEGKLIDFTEKQAFCLRDLGCMIRSAKEAYPCKSCERMERRYCVFGDSLNGEGICFNYRKRVRRDK
ncbi:MAG: hypothetical protein AB7V16_07055 [Vulcanibacillus sp.]